MLLSLPFWVVVARQAGGVMAKWGLLLKGDAPFHPAVQPGGVLQILYQ